jgi:hypothetical protein
LEEIQAFIAGPSHINFSTAGNLLFLDDTRSVPAAPAFLPPPHSACMQEAAVF